VTPAGDTMEVALPSGPTALPLAPLPERLLAWLREGRRELYRALAEDREAPTFFAQHLPALVTWGQGVFPANCGNKGVGFLPRPERLGEFTYLYRRVMARTRGRPWRESLPERLEAVARLNEGSEAIDPRCLGTLEIFERTALENLRATPLASLLFTGTSPSYLSYQVNCAVEVVGEGDPRHDFLVASRTLFEFDGFHIAQPRFRHAYVFWVSETLDKTPHRVPSPGRGEPGSAVPWEPGAEQALERVPAFVRRHVRGHVEAYARERGFAAVSEDLLAEARRAMRLHGG